MNMVCLLLEISENKSKKFQENPCANIGRESNQPNAIRKRRIEKWSLKTDETYVLRHNRHLVIVYSV